MPEEPANQQPLNTNTAMVPKEYEPPLDPTFIRAKNGLMKAVEEKAKEQMEQWENVTQTQRQAIFLGECLRQLNGVDFVTLNLRAHYLRKIFTSNAIANHPGVENGDVKQFLKGVGMTPLEVSRIADLWNYVFPWIEENLLVSPSEFYMNVGSALWDILPVFKALATGNTEGVRGTVVATMDRLLGEVYATAAQTGEEVDEAQARRLALENLVERATNLPVRELRNHLRAGNEEGIYGTYVKNGNTGVFLAKVSMDQWKRLLGVTRDWMTPQTLDLETVPERERRQKLREVPEYVALEDV